MSARKLGLGLAGLLLCSGMACNEIAGIGPAEDNGCNPFIEASEARVVGCMFRVSCDPFLPPYTMSQCVSMAWQDSAASEACTAGAQNCGDIDACIGRRYEPVEACAGGSGSGWMCDDTGDRAINCASNGQYSVDCELFGGTCLPHTSTSVPTAYGCQTNSPPTCPTDAVDGYYYCDGSQRYTCIDGEPRGVDCAGISSDCVVYGTGIAFCSDRTEECDNAGTIGCDGDVVDLCDGDGYRARYDCSIEGLECGEDTENSFIECLADGCQTATECTEGCEGGATMRYCLGGTPRYLDCTDYGYDGCAEDELGEGYPLAFCANNSGGDPHP